MDRLLMEAGNVSSLSNSSMVEDEEAGQGKLLPTLLQIFLTVFLGWLSGTLGIFGTKEARGLGIFVSKYSLPALIFISLASLNLSDIKWSFLLAILVSKSIIFFTVLTVDLLLNRNMSRAALFAIYSTQTNDHPVTSNQPRRKTTLSELPATRQLRLRQLNHCPQIQPQ